MASSTISLKPQVYRMGLEFSGAMLFYQKIYQKKQQDILGF